MLKVKYNSASDIFRITVTPGKTADFVPEDITISGEGLTISRDAGSGSIEIDVLDFYERVSQNITSKLLRKILRVVLRHISRAANKEDKTE